MQNFHVLDTSVLVDLLASHTSDYIRMLSEGASEEDFARCKLSLRAIQVEIESRRNSSTNTTANNPGNVIPEYTK